MVQVLLLTLKEIARKRVFLAGLVLTALYLILFATAVHYSAKDSQSTDLQVFLMKQFGYQFMCLGWYLSTFMIGSLMIIIASGSLASEIENGTILGLASRPLGRGAIIAGKFLAYLIIGVFYSVILLMSIALISNHSFHLLLNLPDLFLGVTIFMLFPLLLLAITFLGSASLGTAATSVICFFLFTMAIIAGFMEQIGAMIQNAKLVSTGIVGSLIMPSDAVYRLAIHHAGGEVGGLPIAGFGPFGTTSLPSNWMLVYTLVYIIVVIIMAWRTFARRDL